MANLFQYDLLDLPVIRSIARGVKKGWLRGERGNVARTLLFLDLAEAVRLGVPLDQALKLIARDPEGEFSNFGVKFLARELYMPVHQGLAFSDAMRRLGRVFSRQEILIVRMGEQYGLMAQAFKRLAEYGNTSQRLRRIREYMTYPVTVALMGVVLVSFIFVFILPKFQDMYTQLGGELPQITRIVIGLSKLIIYKSPFMLTTLLVLFLVFRLADSVIQRHSAVPLFYQLPILRGLYTSLRNARWLAAFTLNLEAGVPAEQALAHAGEISGGELERRSRAAAELVAGGTPIGEACLRCRVLERWINHRLQLIDWRGNYVDNVRGIVEDADRRVTGAMDRLGQRSEVFYILAIGTIIGLIAISIYMPLFHISRLIAWY